MTVQQRETSYTRLLGTYKVAPTAAASCPGKIFVIFSMYAKHSNLPQHQKMLEKFQSFDIPGAQWFKIKLRSEIVGHHLWIIIDPFSNVLDLRNLQEQVKKTFCFKCSSDLSLQCTVRINCSRDLQILGLKSPKLFLITWTISSHSRLEQFSKQNFIFLFTWDS